MVTYEQAREAGDKFTDEFYKPPYDEYLSLVGVGPIKNVELRGFGWVNNWISRTQDKSVVRGKLPIRPSKKDNLEDWCVMVGVKKKIPEETELPSEYQGVKVFYRKLGEAKYF